MRTVKNAVSRVLEEEGIISQELVDAISDENLEVPLMDMSVLDVAPQEYKIDNNLQADPVGVAGKRITGNFLNIVARASLKKNLEHSFEQAKVEIADLLIAPIALANAVLTESEILAWQPEDLPEAPKPLGIGVKDEKALSKSTRLFVDYVRTWVAENGER